VAVNKCLHTVASSWTFINIEDEMVKACAHIGGGEVQTGLWWGNLRERDHLEVQDIGGRK